MSPIVRIKILSDTVRILVDIAAAIALLTLKNMIKDVEMIHLKYSLRNRLLCSAALLFAASPLFAQRNGETVDLGKIVIEADVTALADEEDGIVPTTTSTSTKSSLPLERNPRNISVVTGEELQLRQAQRGSEALRYTPGVSSEVFGADPRADWIRSRSFILPEYLDGQKLARGVFAWPRPDAFFLERYEVLKGPAGSLYGQTPPGGILNMVSKKPTKETVRQIGIQVGDPKRAQLTADFGGKLNKDGTFSYRFVGLMREADTGVDYINDDRRALYGAVNWSPSDRTSLTLQAYKIHDNAKSLQFLPVTGTLRPGPQGYLPRNRFFGEPDWDDYKLEQTMVGYLFSHQFENGVKLNHNLRWSNVDYDLKSIGAVSDMFPNGTVARMAFHIVDYASTLNVDTNLTFGFDTGAAHHNVVAGFDYLERDSKLRYAARSMGIFDAYNPTYGGVAPPLSTLSPVWRQNTDFKQTGLYVQDEITTGNWTFLLSARNSCYKQKDFDLDTGTTQTADDSAFTWRVGAVYSFENGVSPYLSYATSFEALPGVNTATGNPLKPTESKQAEIGIKYRPTGFNGLFTLAAFDLRQTNRVVGTGLNVTQVGEARVRGLELEGRGELSNGLTIAAAYAYQDAKNLDTGRALTQVPKDQASLWLSYDFSGPLEGLTLAGGLRYTGGLWGDSANAVKIKKRTLIDASASYRLGELSPKLKNARLDVSISNLTDKKYVASCFNSSGASCYWGEGRTIRANLVFNF